MANPEHVKVVRKGATAIAEWRQAHPDERLDLSGADFSDTDLGEAKLSGANLSGASLERTDLRWANLRETKFRQANLRQANLLGADFWGGVDFWRADLRETNLATAYLSLAYLKEANLGGAHLRLANLVGANLSEANLSEAYLFDANFSGADLSGADVSRAKLAFTSLTNLDLSGVKGLSDVEHRSPSSIGVDTLMASFRGAGNRLTPELTAFFRGAGVPQELLDGLPGIAAEIKHYSCFISYGEPDVGFATRLDGDLRARNVNCWTYEKDKTVGKPTWGEIEQKLDEYERIVVLCSIKALIRDGFKKEIDKQIDKNPDKLIPVSLDDDWKQHGFKAEWAGRDLKTWLLDRNYADFANKPHEEALEELLKGLRRPPVKKPRRKKG